MLHLQGRIGDCLLGSYPSGSEESTVIAVQHVKICPQGTRHHASPPLVEGSALCNTECGAWRQSETLTSARVSAARAVYQYAMKGTGASCEKGRVIVITGPTGVGKSSVAISLAKRLNGEIISADSVQVYKGLDVGSAKTPLKDRQGIPHHLIDIVEPTQEYSVGDFFTDARAATESVLARGRVPIVVGGTGLYLRWFMSGKPDTPKPTEEQSAAVEAEISELQRAGGGWDAGVQYLAEAGDPETAHKLARNDWYRLRRSLEILKISGRPQSSFPLPWMTARDAPLVESTDLGSHHPDGGEQDYDFQCYFLFSKRMELYRRIDQRCEEMLIDPEGLLGESSYLLDQGVLPNTSPPSRAIGYRHAMEYLRACRMAGGYSSPAEFLSFLHGFQKASRNYAKRQLTWFRSDDKFRWIDASASTTSVVCLLENEFKRQSGFLAPPPLSTKIDERTTGNERELKALKTYTPQNRIFTDPAACASVLEWLRRTQCGFEVII